jgi:hypothetical protein
MSTCQTATPQPQHHHPRGLPEGQRFVITYLSLVIDPGSAVVALPPRLVHVNCGSLKRSLLQELPKSDSTWKANSMRGTNLLYISLGAPNRMPITPPIHLI